MVLAFMPLTAHAAVGTADFTIEVAARGHETQIINENTKGSLVRGVDYGGMITYVGDDVSGTLTLTDFSFSTASQMALWTHTENLTIVLNGTNTITNSSPDSNWGWGVYADYNLTIKGDGSLTIVSTVPANGRSNYGLEAMGDFTLESGTVIIKADGDTTYKSARLLDLAASAVVVKGGTLICAGSHSEAINDAPYDLPTEYTWEYSTATAYDPGSGTPTDRGSKGDSDYTWVDDHMYVKIAGAPPHAIVSALVDYTAPVGYTVIVPSIINLTYQDTGAVVADLPLTAGAVLNGGTLSIPAEGSGAAKAFTIVNRSDVTKVVAYQISKLGSVDFSSVAPAGEITSFTAANENDLGTPADITNKFYVKAPDWTAANKDGTYRGNLYFTCTYTSAVK
jgi:hypothetical protein